MADYKRMYAVLCGAIDDVLDPLQRIPGTFPQTAVLQKALWDAEEIYIRTSAYIQPGCGEVLPSIRMDNPETE